MVTRRLVIKERLRTHPIQVVGPRDFIFEPGEEISPELVRDDPRFTLYCFDLAGDLALFAECPDSKVVDDAAFYYQAQAEHAVGFVAMPLEVFHRVGQGIPTPPDGLIFVHSVGRCGSTLVSKLLAGFPDTHSHSEPDDLTQMIPIRVEKAISDETLRGLIASSIKWRCKPGTGDSARTVAIKTRSEVLVLGDLISSEFRSARHVFLYRSTIPWMASIFRGYPDHFDVNDAARNLAIAQSWSRTLPLVGAMIQAGVPLNPIQTRILAWIQCTEAYLQLAETCTAHCAIRYESFSENPIPILDQFFYFCGFKTVDWRSVHAVLGRDSQEGTCYSREEREKGNQILTEPLIQDIYDLIATRPSLRTPNVILPGTIR